MCHNEHPDRTGAGVPAPTLPKRRTFGLLELLPFGQSFPKTNTLIPLLPQPIPREGIL